MITSVSLRLLLRHWQSVSDLPQMMTVANTSRTADGLKGVTNLETMHGIYVKSSGFDPAVDVVIAEVDGQMVGFARGWWLQEVGGAFLYRHVGFVAPHWRRHGIGSAMLAWLERRQTEVASNHDADAEKLFNVFVTEPEVNRAALLEKAGYRPARYFFSMVRLSLESITDFALPWGIELRPTLPQYYQAIWDVEQEVFASHWGRARPVEGDFDAWLASAAFQPQLWQVGWDVGANCIAGQTRPYIDHAHNQQTGRLRGHTENIVVRERWRRRGLAKALISHSLRAQADARMRESALEVDSENPSGATKLYEACGFRTEERNVVYRKELALAH